MCRYSPEDSQIDCEYIACLTQIWTQWPMCDIDVDGTMSLMAFGIMASAKILT